MQQPRFPPELAEAIRTVARERSLEVAHDTHYDAENMELRWWAGRQLRRVDFQPMPEGHVVVTSLMDTHPFFGRVWRWARRFVPLFPHIGKTEHRPLGTIQPSFATEPLRSRISEFLRLAA